MHLVLAHPLSDSLNAHIAEHIAARLVANEATIDRLDLYAEGFSPALTATERQNYGAKPQSGPDIHPLQQRLAAADHLILVFPTWWFALPAILKGWVDRIFMPGFAFTPGTPIKPLLTNLKSVLVVTTLGSPWWIDTIVMRRPLRRVLKTALFAACAPQARFHMLSLHEAESVDAVRLSGFKIKLDKTLARVMLD